MGVCIGPDLVNPCKLVTSAMLGHVWSQMLKLKTVVPKPIYGRFMDFLLLSRIILSRIIENEDREHTSSN